MPTAGRLTGAMAYALLGGVLAWLLIPFFDAGRVPDYWAATCVGTGLLVGWILVGTRVNQRTGVAIGTGLTAAAALAFWVLFIIGARRMIADSMRGRYDGPTDAVIGVFANMIDDGQQFADPAILLLLVLGSLAAALLTNLIGTRFR
ncbi:hypothetical protein SAMN04488003_12318 [Loktanella fryxellensis]|uniref:TrgA family protein n=1 Tax=Loktanella fryxellensis TaxID=245187 RepID=A0A1H8I0Y6_9RHOB|nr:TrgA family protein [Loktanella fryxellensis]SEN61937.1 hypothetical protein SAMN04488003_12318 [Loktanella fryxellensis]